MSARFLVAVLALGMALSGPVLAADVGYIYGRVETTSGAKYKGQLRWGTEEAFWDDIFNSTKAENENLANLDPKVLDDIRDRHWNGWNVFGDNEPDLTHVFAIRFGDLRRLEVRNHGNVVAEFRNGEELMLNGGSNDIGAEITVIDPKAGRKEIAWGRIRTIEFMDTPANFESQLGEPIYGTVKSGRYDFTGRIQWDNDETLTSDKLDGRSEDGKASIEFGDIASIRKYRSGVLATLRSGEELYLTGTNDVNSENRGVVVIVPRLGSVKIGWEDFDEVTFSRAPKSGRSYADYAQASPLRGSVVTRDGRWDGQIVFDLDESRDFELLQGKNGDTEYLIPFREIARIRPEGRRRSVVELKMGLTVELEGSQDVTLDNDGVLVFEGTKKPRYVGWQDVDEIVFR